MRQHRCRQCVGAATWRRSRQQARKGLARLTLSSMNMMPIQIFASRQKLGQPAHSGVHPGRITPESASSACSAPAGPGGSGASSTARTARFPTGPDCGRSATWPDRTRLRPASRSAVQPAAGLRPCPFRAPTVCKMAGETRAIQEPRSTKATLSSATTRKAHRTVAVLHLASLRPR